MTEDYRKSPLAYRIRKVIRYTRLYGVSRTWAKVRGANQLPLETSPPQDWTNPECRDSNSPSRGIAIIGCGNFAFSTIAHYCYRADRHFLRSVFDVNGARAKALCRAYRGARTVSSVDEIAADPAVKLVFIASNHASHATYAAQMLQAGKDVHIEKPHVVNWAQLEELSAAMIGHPERKVYLGFNRRRSPLFRWIQAHLASQSTPLMVSWFIAGHAIPADHWYFSKEEGGRILGNICHWTDLTLRLVGPERAFPVEIVPGSAPGSQSDFVLTFRFHEGSTGVIVFSAKGQTFEGVREHLNVHRGDVLASLQDFQRARVDIRERKLVKRLLFRDHGHEANIMNSFRLGPGIAHDDLVATASLFLATRDAVERGGAVVATGRVPALIG